LTEASQGDDRHGSQPNDFVGVKYLRERSRMGRWVAMGYASIAALVLVPVLTLLGVAACVYPLLGGVPSALLVLLAAFYGVDTVKALRGPADSDDKEALTLREQDAPALFALMDSVRARVGGPVVSKVVLSNRLNASVSQRTSFPWIGRTRHTMDIGLPLLCLLPAEQIGAIIAHEFGHLKGQHGLLSRRVYGLRQCLIRLQEAPPEAKPSPLRYANQLRRVSCAGLRLFLRWYVPLLDAKTFAVRRAGEYVADQVSTRWDGPQTAIDALYSLELAERYMALELWPGVWRQARHSPTPAGDPFAQLAFGTPMQDLDAARATEWVYHALRARTGDDDTHPSLRDRVTQMGADTQTITLSMPDAAAHRRILSEPFLREAVAALDRQWLSAAESDWHCHHQRWQDTVAAHEALRLRSTTQRLSGWDWLAMSARSRSLQLPTWEDELERAHALEPDDPDMLYAMGIAHQERGELASAVDFLTRAMELDRREVMRCSRELTCLSLTQGDAQATAKHRQRADEMFAFQALVDEELSRIQSDDELAVHDLSLHRFRQVQKDLRPMLHHAQQIWLVKKISRTDGEFSRYGLVVMAGTTGWRYAVNRLLLRGGRQREICRRIAANLHLDLPSTPLWYFCKPNDPLAWRLSSDEMPALK
jgi:Zn-dependent protease with chaperone function